MTNTVIPAKVAPYENQPNTVYVSETNEPDSIHINYIPQNSGNFFSPQKPIVQGGGQCLAYTLNAPSDAVLSTPNSYFSYTIQHCMKIYNVDPTNKKGNNNWFGRYKMRNNEIWFEQCLNLYNGTDGKQSVADLSFTGTLAGVVNKVTPQFAAPVKLCMAPMNATSILKKTIVNYGGNPYEDDWAFLAKTYPQLILPEEYQANMNTTWFNQDMSDVWCYDVIPYNYVPIDGTNPIVNIKNYCTVGDWGVVCKGQYIVKDITDTYNPTGADFQFCEWDNTAKVGTVYFTFNKTYIIPLNLLNQIFDTSNMFYLNLLKGQNAFINIYLSDYAISRVIGVDWLFNTQYTGIASCDLVMVTKKSQVIKNDVESKDIITKIYGKYQWQRMNTQLMNSYIDQPITTTHNSVQDIIFGLFLQDDNNRYTPYKPIGATDALCSNGDWITPKAPADKFPQKLTLPDNAGTYNDSTYIKQRYTLYNQQALLNMDNGIFDKSEQFVFFNDFNLYRGDQSGQVFGRGFNNIDQLKQEINRTLNLIQQYNVSGTRCLYNITEYMKKYAMMAVSLEAFTMDCPGNRDVAWDGYYSRERQLRIHSGIGIFERDPYDSTGIPQYGQGTVQGKGMLTQKTYIVGQQYNLAYIQIFDEALKIKPKDSGNQMSQNEELKT